MTENYTAMVIDDDREMRRSLTLLLERAGWRATAHPSAEAALSRLDSVSPDVILSDVRMNGMSGIDVLEALSNRYAPPLILISAHADVAMAVEAMQKGAYSFLEKPYEPRRLLTILRHAADQHRLSGQAQRLRDQLASVSGLNRVLLGNDLRIASLKDRAIDLASASGPVLISGQTGTGKEVVARALHRLGPGRDAPFIALNCATLSPDRIDAQLFGTEDGLRGCFRRADGGTLFLDEVGACPLDVQAKLLRALDTGEVVPVGSEDTIATKVRVIAATNEDLDAAVAAGSFRADVLYRLNTFELHLPPLSERGDDVVLIYEHFVGQLSETYEISSPDLTSEDAAALLAYDWPGNVRELRHVAERRVLSARRGGGSVAEALRMDDLTDDVPATLREAVARFERTLIAQAITAHGGRMDAVAEALGIGRRTLNEKLVKLGLERDSLLT